MAFGLELILKSSAVTVARSHFADRRRPVPETRKKTERENEGADEQ